MTKFEQNPIQCCHLTNFLIFHFCRNELQWDDDDVYVIGGLVDVDIKSNASLGTIHILRNQF